MNVQVIRKPALHCPIPYGHALYKGYVPHEDTDIRKTWARATQADMLDDFELTERTAHIDLMGEFPK